VTRPRLLDLFCGAGGAAMGYSRAGFDVVGVDNRPQPRYPFEFHQGDAMTWPLDGYDAIHASPPCQDHMRTPGPTAHHHGTGWMLSATRARLIANGKPWVIENVPGAAMTTHLVICGCVVGLGELERERWFETWPPLFDLRAPCLHEQPVIGVYGNTGRKKGQRRAGVADWQRAMGIDWMIARELSQAIPPAYTEHIGRQLLDHLERAA
jgi:DNA (cytosine-5)-methyltransferase 1